MSCSKKHFTVEQCRKGCDGFRSLLVIYKAVENNTYMNKPIKRLTVVSNNFSVKSKVKKT